MLVLRTMPQLAALDEDDLAILAEHAHLVVSRPGTRLFAEGDPLDRIYLLSHGAVRVRYAVGRERVIEQGEIGLHSLFAGREVTPEVTVLRESTLLELPARVVMSSFYDSPSIARNTIRMAARALLSRRENLPLRLDLSGEAELGRYPERSPTLVERMLTLRRMPLWSEANLDAIAEIAKHLEEVRVPASTLLWNIGEPSIHSVRLEHGIVLCENEKGDRVRVGSGHLLGGLDALAGLPRSYRVVTETDCVLYRIRASTQLAVLEVHPAMSARIRTELSRALLEEQERGDSVSPPGH